MSVFDFDGFLALEQMAEKRKALESFCRLHAPIGILDRFIEYEAKMRKQRKKGRGTPTSDRANHLIHFVGFDHRY